MTTIKQELKQIFPPLCTCIFLCSVATVGLAQPEDTAVAQESQPPERVIRNERVTLEVTEFGALAMKTPSKCPAVGAHSGFPEKGCVKAHKNEGLSVEFDLVGQTSNSACASPYRYQLDGIQLGNKNGLKPSTSQWENPGNSLDEEVLADFAVDAESGWVTIETKANGNVVLSSDNKSQAGYYVWYRVRATCSNPDDSHAVYYDPRLPNEGND